jgi:hypothetical protein
MEEHLTMPTFPEDIFTEPANVDPDTLANLGPLTRLAGVWQSSNGRDTNPKADGPEHRDYIERITFDPIDPQANGPQLFYGLRYHTHITTAEEDITFHDQVGYWLWEPATGLVLQTLALPRGQIAIAAGNAKPSDDNLVLAAERGQTEYGICSTSFLEHAFRTDRYTIALTFDPDGSFSYVLDTTLFVRGQGSFMHRDQNRLIKIAGPKPNPWMQIISARRADDPTPGGLSADL